MFENPRRGRQAIYFTTNVPKILDLKSSSEQIFSENWRWVPLMLLPRSLGVYVRNNRLLWTAPDACGQTSPVRPVSLDLCTVARKSKTNTGSENKVLSKRQNSLNSSDADPQPGGKTDWRPPSRSVSQVNFDDLILRRLGCIKLNRCP